MEENTARTIVKIFAILHYIGAGFSILAGLAMLIMGPAIMSAMPFDETAGAFAGLLGGAMAFVGVMFIALGILSIFVGRGLWQHKNWARIVLLVFAVLSVLSIVGGNVLGLVLGAIQIWLFGFNKTVKGLFTKE